MPWAILNPVARLLKINVLISFGTYFLAAAGGRGAFQTTTAILKIPANNINIKGIKSISKSDSACNLELRYYEDGTVREGGCVGPVPIFAGTEAMLDNRDGLFLSKLIYNLYFH